MVTIPGSIEIFLPTSAVSMVYKVIDTVDMRGISSEIGLAVDTITYFIKHLDVSAAI